MSENIIPLPRIPRILATTALCLAAVGVTSCTIIDTGSTLDNVGKQIPHRLLVKEKRGQDTWHKEAPLGAWKKGDNYYVELPVAYIPASIRNQNHLILNISLLRIGQFCYPDIDGSCKFIADRQKTKEVFYAVLTEEQFRLACTDFGKWETPPLAGESFPILSASDVNPDGAERLPAEYSRKLENGANVILNRLPVRRTLGNQFRRPLTWVLNTADIPLSLAASPVGWLVNLIYYPFSK